MNNADKDSEPDSSKDGSLDLLLDTALAVFALPIGSNLIFLETFTGIAKEHHAFLIGVKAQKVMTCLLYTSPSPRDRTRSRMPSSA